MEKVEFLKVTEGGTVHVITTVLESVEHWETRHFCLSCAIQR